MKATKTTELTEEERAIVREAVMAAYRRGWALPSQMGAMIQDILEDMCQARAREARDRGRCPRCGSGPEWHESARPDGRGTQLCQAPCSAEDSDAPESGEGRCLSQWDPADMG